jgi:hypothetical protein
MEVAGLAVGIAALAGLFESALGCFDRIQASKSFGTEFETLVIRLDCAHLRLARWGQANGLGSEVSQEQSLQGTTILKDEVQRAERLLSQIVNLFDQAEKQSNKYRGQEVDSEEDLTEPSLTLHRCMRAICARRQKGTSLMKKAKWALHGRESFVKLVDSAHGLVGDLTTLFASSIPTQAILCDEEAASIPGVALRLLKDIAAQDDSMLEAAISKLELAKVRTRM